MITLKIKSHLHKYNKDKVLHTDSNYITNGEFLFSLSEVEIPNVHASYNPLLTQATHALLSTLKKLKEINPCINKANCIILDLHSFIPSEYVYILKPFLKDSQYKFYTYSKKVKVVGDVNISTSTLFIYRGTEFVGVIEPMVCSNTKTCSICNEV